MQSLGIIREFKTKNFKVIVDVVEEFDPDLSFDETGEVINDIESGKLVLFCARARVIHRPTGIELGTDYLGDCIYPSLSAFMDHKECGKQNREYEARGESGRCGSYFADMVRESIREARKNLESLHVNQ